MTQGGDFSDALSKLLDNPEALKGLMSLAGSLMNSQSSASPETVQTQQPTAQPPPTQETQPSVQTSQMPIAAPNHGSADALTNLLAISPKSSKNDPRTTLLYALKPYLNPSRRDKVDSLVKALQLASLASSVLGGKLF